MSLASGWRAFFAQGDPVTNWILRSGGEVFDNQRHHGPGIFFSPTSATFRYPAARKRFKTSITTSGRGDPIIHRGASSDQ
jgi:hypothetical protein